VKTSLIKLASGLMLKAAVCPICGGRIYPIKALKAHRERHIQNSLLLKWINREAPHWPKRRFRHTWDWSCTGGEL
jgi:hypothetical protein